MKVNCEYTSDCSVYKVDCDMCIRNSLYTHWFLGDHYYADRCEDCTEYKLYETCEDPICEEFHRNYIEEEYL